MLSSASDYEYVDMTGITVAGDIMPVRHGVAGSKATVMFEDYLFMLEAMLERQNVDVPGQNNTSPGGKTLLVASMRAVEPGYSTYYGVSALSGPTLLSGARSFYINPASTLPTAAMIVQQYICEGIANADFVPATQATAYNYRSLRPLWSQSHLFGEYMRALYYDYNRMSRLCVPISIGDIATSAWYDYTVAGGTTTRITIPLTHQAFHVYGRSTDGTTTDMGFTEKSSLATFQHAVSAKLIMLMHVGPPQSGGTRYVVPAAVSVQVGQGGVIGVPTGFFQNAAIAAAQEAGESTSNVSVDCNGLMYVIDFEFPARLNGITWNWTPQSSSSP